MKGYNEFLLTRRNIKLIPKELSGVYGIRNDTNTRIYVGASVNIRSRVGIHFSSLRKAKHHCLKLQEEYSKQKGKDFSFLILETINRKKQIQKEVYELLAEKELFWINQHPAEKRYNKQKPEIRGKRRRLTYYDLVKDILVLLERDYNLHKGAPNLQLTDFKQILDSNIVKNAIDFYNFVANYAIKHKRIIDERVIEGQRYYVFKEVLEDGEDV